MSTSVVQATGSKGSLRERTRQAMRSEVVEIAFRLFAEQGFERTTVEQIAVEAGLSRTTFFRYFGTKEEVVLERMASIGDDLAAALAARPPHEQAWTALRRTFDLITDLSSSDPEAHKRVRLLYDACKLLTHDWERTKGWQSRLVPVLYKRVGQRDLNALPRATAVVSSAIACFHVAIDEWITSGGRTPLAELTDSTMDALAPL